MKTILVFVLALLTTGCVFRDVREQQASIEAACLIEGTVASARAESRPIVVLLAQRVPGASGPKPGWRLVDHFVLEQPGRWVFLATPGEYAFAAFEDTNRDLVYQPGEPFVGLAATPTIACKAGERANGIALAIPAVPAGRFDTEIDVAALQARTYEGQVTTTLGQLTAVGEIAKLSDARFSEENAKNGLWRPFDFVIDRYAGVYFLEPYDPRKIPVLFVHGINGTPANFTYLIEHLDRSRFQPWVYYYPSGVRLAYVASHLSQTMAKLQLRHGFTRYAVVAHSMGGLVARGFIQRYAQAGGAEQIPLFVSISTPWAGHRGAELGVKTAPTVVWVWEDMVPGSAYVKSLFAQPLPAATAHHLLFTFNRKEASFGGSDDTLVSVASQLDPAAQRNAARIYGFDDTHMGVLRDAEVSKVLNELLGSGRYRP
ncbi:hypothetical protein BWI17_18570 [Betaproteobacteria bacterium GR16-43]|nr:hypothetical protein BWI17_18570 [Betaproteobacteria bacterium GR16-43]